MYTHYVYMSVKFIDASQFATLAKRARLGLFRLSNLTQLHRMASTMQRTMVQPHRIFNNSFTPQDPPALERLSPVSVTLHDSPLHWEESSDDETMIRTSLNDLQVSLRCVHKRKVPWPPEGSVYSASPQQYLVALLQPVADLYNELHSRAVLTEAPMKSVAMHLGKSICAATFSMSDNERRKWCISIPMVIALEDDIIDRSGNVTNRTENTLRLALDLTPSGSLQELILVTNFRDVVAFFPAWSKHPKNSFARVLTTTPMLALQAVCAASIHDNGLFVDVPNPEWAPHIDMDLDIILPMGPPQDPQQPLLPDEEVFRTHFRFSDFDKASLVRDSARALQFFRWHSFVRSNNSKLVVGLGDIVNVKVFDATEILAKNPPLYPFNWSDLPTETAVHLRAVQRPCPVEQAGLAGAFQSSKAFQLKITGVIAKGTDHGFATVYRCQLISIDDNPVLMSASLCLKLFDDRFMGLEYPGGNEGDLSDKPLHHWFETVIPVADLVLNELHTYENLRPVQGTVVPRCYGAHEFVLPNQTILPGILMEYIPENTAGPGPGLTGSLSSEQQINMIKSCRHAARTLDLADVDQADWHPGQILFHTNPETQVDHCVFIDFALTRMTYFVDEPIQVKNYSGCLHALFKISRKGVFFDPIMLQEHYGKPDDWDPVKFVLPYWVSPEYRALPQAEDPFTYISFKSI